MAIFLAQTAGGKYGDQTTKAWAWFIPTLMPTLSLIVGVIAAQARTPDDPKATVGSTAYRLSLWFSIVYLALVIATPLIEPFADPENPLDFLNLATIWLTPVNTLTGIALGALFVSKEKTEGNDKTQTEIKKT